jgi:hypothetical protein
MLDLPTEIESHDASTSLPAKAIELAALALRRPTAAGLAYGYAWLSLDHWRGWAVIDYALRRHRRSHPLLDDGRHLEDARTPDERVDTVADLHLCRRLGRRAIHANVAAAAGGRRLRTGLIDPDGPQPDVYPGLVDMVIVPASTAARLRRPLR